MAAPEPSPSSPVLVIDGTLDRARFVALSDRARALVGASGADALMCDVRGILEPDLAAVDLLCQLQLAVRRLGARITLRAATPELRELLALTGLRGSAGLRLETRGQAEEREEAGGVEEEDDPADPPA